MTRHPAVIPGVPEFLWVVDDNLDLIRRKPYHEATAKLFGVPRYRVYRTAKEDAIEALLDRARGRVAAARGRVAAAEREFHKELRRLNGLERKFQVGEGK